MALTSALLTRLGQGSEVKLDLGQQVVTMVRSLYNTKHKLPAQVSNKQLSSKCVTFVFSLLKESNQRAHKQFIYNHSDWIKYKKNGAI